jgi:hypothetical protein
MQPAEPHETPDSYDAGVLETEDAEDQALPAGEPYSELRLDSESVAEWTSVEQRAEPPREDAADDVAWRADATPEEIEDVTWAADPIVSEEAGDPLGAEPADGLPQEELPLLGNESSVPLNDPRRQARYFVAGPQRRERRSGPIRGPNPMHAARQPEPPSGPPSPSAQERADLPEKGTSGRPAAVDVGAMIARMRRVREQREREHEPEPAVSEPRVGEVEPIEPRFHAGQRVRCVPYGEGVVCDAWVVDGREQLEVELEDGTRVTVDAAVNAVRELEGPRSDDIDADN